METDFTAAASRHRSDANFLQDAGRLDNADQLWGICAECAIKAVLHGMSLSRHPVLAGEVAKTEWGHAEKVWRHAVSCFDGRSGGRFAAALGDGDPFEGWSISQRYAKSCVQMHIVQWHRHAAHRALHLLDQARADGVLS